MAVKKHLKHLFKVIDKFIISLTPELETGFFSGGELNFDKPFLQFNIKKHCIRKFLLDLT